MTFAGKGNRIKRENSKKNSFILINNYNKDKDKDKDNEEDKKQENEEDVIK